LSVRHQAQPRALPSVLVQNALLTPGPGRVPASVSIYQYGDVPRTNPHWAGVQLVSARELLAGNGVDTFFVDRQRARPEGAGGTAGGGGPRCAACPWSPARAPSSTTSPPPTSPAATSRPWRAPT